MDLDENKIYRNGEALKLTPYHTVIMYSLVECFPRPASYDKLASDLSVLDPPDKRSLYTHVCELRKKLPALGLDIEPIRSRGYKLVK